jgi:hypothetical protein
VLAIVSPSLFAPTPALPRTGGRGKACLQGAAVAVERRDRISTSPVQ